MNDFRIEGSDALNALGKTLGKIGDGKEIREALHKALLAAGQPTADDMRATLGTKLPKRGGASRLLTKKKKTFAVRKRLTSSRREAANVRITSNDKTHDYRSLEVYGTLRHPVWPGRPPRRNARWVEQKVPTKGVLEGVMDDHQDEFVEQIGRAMQRTAKAIEKSLDDVT
jgi:hypothetical protein